MLVKITCPECNVDGNITLVDTSYEGPYKCWKCRQLFAVKLKNGAVLSCEVLSQEDFEKLQEIESLKNKYRNR
ncbi:hypothetical protein ACFLYB_00880 [Chloroflexota bacterium]